MNRLLKKIFHLKLLTYRYKYDDAIDANVNPFIIDWNA